MASTTLKGGVIVSFQASEGSIEHFPARYDDNVEPGGHFMTPEHLAGQALGAVAINGRPDLSCRCHAEPWHRAAVRQHEYGHEPAMRLRPCLVNAFELGSAADAFGGRQCLSAHAGSF